MGMVVNGLAGKVLWERLNDLSSDSSPPTQRRSGFPANLQAPEVAFQLRD
jgi:hypothetical protein